MLPGHVSPPGLDQVRVAADVAEQKLTRVRAARDEAGNLVAAAEATAWAGPRGRTHLDRAVGYIKTHHVSYLPPEQAAVVSALRPGQRTPRSPWAPRGGAPAGTSSCRAPRAYPGRGVLRLECSADLPLAKVIRLADLTARVLPPPASVARKDPRGPAEPGPDRRPRAQAASLPRRPADPLPRPARGHHAVRCGPSCEHQDLMKSFDLLSGWPANIT
jgi:hypothetical protein